MAVERGRIEVSGLKELGQQLNRLEGKVKGKTFRSAVSAAMLPMLQAARANAAAVRDSGALAAAMGRWSRTQRGLVGAVRVIVFVGPKSKSKRGLALWNARHKQERPARRLQHGHLTEFGTERSRAQPYLRPAFDTTKVAVVQRLKTTLKAAIAKVART